MWRMKPHCLHSWGTEKHLLVLGMVGVLFRHKFLDVQGQPCEQGFKRAGTGLAVSMLLSAGIFMTHHIDTEHSPSFKNSQGPTFHIRKMSQSSFIQLHIAPPPLKYNNSGTIVKGCQGLPVFHLHSQENKLSLHVIYVRIKVGLLLMYPSRLYTSASTWEQNLKKYINSAWRELIFRNWVHGAFNINTSFLPTFQ